MPSAPLKLRPYGDIEIRLLLLLSDFSALLAYKMGNSHYSGGVKYTGWEKICDCRPKSPLARYSRKSDELGPWLLYGSPVESR